MLNVTLYAQWDIDPSYMVSVPGVTFTQPGGTNSFNHTLSPFEMGKYEVTYELYYGVFHWTISNGYNNEMAGHTPVYENESGQVIKDSRDSNGTECDGSVPDWNNSCEGSVIFLLQKN